MRPRYFVGPVPGVAPHFNPVFFKDQIEDMYRRDHPDYDDKRDRDRERERDRERDRWEFPFQFIFNSLIFLSSVGAMRMTGIRREAREIMVCTIITYLSCSSPNE